MRAITIPRFGPPEVLTVVESPDPIAGPGEVRVRVAAAGLNFAEVTARKGMYPDAPKAPCVVGYEAAGTIDALGDGVTDPALKVGTRVLVLKRFGAHADVLCVPALQAVPIPDDLDFERAAAIPVNYLTAYHMLFHITQLHPGESVLVHMAAGGVGLAVLQLCRTVPNVTIYGTASAGKHAFLREQGCDHPIDYRTKDYVAEVRGLTNGAGVDIVLDALGGADWKKGYKLLKPAGRLIAFGFANVSVGETRNIPHIIKEFLKVPVFTPMGLINTNRLIAGVNMGHMWGEIALLRREIDALMALYRAGKIAPHVDKVYPFTEAAAAHRRIERRENVGKIILVP